MEQYLDDVYFKNTVRDYLFVLGGIIIAWIVLQIIKRIIVASVRRFTSRSKNHIDDILVKGFEKFVIPYVYILINFAIINQLKLLAGVNKSIDIAIALCTVYFGARFINNALQVSLNIYMEKRGEPASRVLQMNGILTIIKGVVWTLGLIFLLDNLGYQVTTIITGLGIGGIAIALAAQNILGDLFSYFVIFFDKPFEVGDFVVTGDKSGTVEQIGIKTSRIRTLGGEELVMPNAELAKSPIHNFKKMVTRRVVFKVQVVYETAPELLKEIPQLIKQVIEAKEKVRFDRAHLQSLGTFSIDYEVVYTVLEADYNLFMDIQQSVLFEIMDVFKERNIQFAYPTQLIKFDEKEETKTGLNIEEITP